MTSREEKRSDRQGQIEEYALSEGGKKRRGEQEVVTKGTKRKSEKAREIDSEEHEVDDTAARG